MGDLRGSALRDAAAGHRHCVDIVSTQWRCYALLSVGGWDLVFGAGGQCRDSTEAVWKLDVRVIVRKVGLSDRHRIDDRHRGRGSMTPEIVRRQSFHTASTRSGHPSSNSDAVAV